MGNLIVAGNGNTIPPSLDALIREVAINANGHKITLSLVGTTLTGNGIAFAHGVVGLFSNATVSSISTDGYVYAELTMHQNEQTADSADLVFSASVKAESTPDISTNAGTYRILVATITSGSITYQNVVQYPSYATYADEAQIVTDSIASNAKGVTQATSDNSAKIATTEFVKNAIEDSKKQSTLSVNITATTNICYNRLGLVGVRLNGSKSGGIYPNDVIATLPVGYRPSAALEITFNTSGLVSRATINTNGQIVAIDNTTANIEINCCFLTS